MRPLRAQIWPFPNVCEGRLYYPIVGLRSTVWVPLIGQKLRLQVDGLCPRVSGRFRRERGEGTVLLSRRHQKTNHKPDGGGGFLPPRPPPIKIGLWPPQKPIKKPGRKKLSKNGPEKLSKNGPQSGKMTIFGPKMNLFTLLGKKLTISGEN